MGDYVLTVDDLRAGREFDDAVARGVFYLDGHKPDDDKRTYILSKEEMQVPPYQIPYRSILVRDGKNLLAAGRCFSADQLALSSARVSTTCSMLGHATGTRRARTSTRRAAVFGLLPCQYPIRRSVPSYGFCSTNPNRGERFWSEPGWRSSRAT